ncbi:MAG: cbb3-type cytochrome oxidase assembly protein CcoS [Planctomycetota bacterium]
MSVIYLLLPLALLLLVTAIVVFLWAARSGQFDDLRTPALRILTDDERPEASEAAPTGAGEVELDGGDSRQIPTSDGSSMPGSRSWE